MSIEFERFERESPANRERRAQGDRRQITYDWRVMVDGVPWAIFMKDTTAQGYHLHTWLQYRAVMTKDGPRGWVDRSRRVGAATKADFKRVIQDCFFQDLLPSPEEQQWLQLIEQAERDDRERTEALELIEDRKRRAGPKLYEAAVEALLFMDAPAESPRAWPVARANLRTLLFEAVAMAEMGDDPDADLSGIEDRLRGHAA